MYVIHATITYVARLHLYCRFRWVVCQLVYLSRCIPGRIRQALKELPTTLDATYARTLEEIDEQNWDYPHRLFQCVAAACRPLRAEELAEFLAFDFKAGSTPTFLTDWRSEDPENEVLSICSTLLVIVQPHWGVPVIQFAHFSVKEYLTSARLLEPKGTISRFHVSMTQAHTIVAQACLGIILHLDENITMDSLCRDFPLAVYAAKHCVDHARFEGVLSKVQDGMKRLFDASKGHFFVWFWIFYPGDQSERYERPAEAKATALHYATASNMDYLATFLIAGLSHDVNARGFDREETPLHVALRLGLVEISRVLLKHGADTEVRENRDSSPLEQVVRDGHVELAQILLEHGADANARDNQRCTPLYWASEGGQLAVAQVLLGHGADVTAQCKNNQTPLHRAKELDVARLLLEHGADPNALDIKNRTPLHCASEGGCAGAARALLEHGVLDANARDANNATPLHLVSGRGSVFMVRRYFNVAQLLLQYGSDVHARDGEGQTPFMRATEKGYGKTMQLLLEHGAEDHRV